MKLVRFRVREFRSVWDSGDIDVGDISCLVGKNEAGKTSLLKALYRLNPLIESDARFDVTDDYPRKEVGDYVHDVDAKRRSPATVIEAIFQIEDAEAKEIEDQFGPRVLKNRTIRFTRGYANHVYFLSVDEDAARLHLSSNAALSQEIRDKLVATKNWQEFEKVLTASEKAGEVNKLIEIYNKIKADTLGRHIYATMLVKHVPKFMYFDDYYQLLGQENVPALIQRKDNKQLLPSDYPLLGLINLARLKLSDLLNVQRTNELTNTLEGAGNHLTRQILKYWSQNRHLHMKFDVREAKPGDPPHMRAGVNIWGKVYDSVHWATTELGARSKGFVWFFSFLAWYEDVKRSGQNVILLLDEPGLSLHGKAQADLLRYFEVELKPHHQVIYSTHSPFMVDPDHFERVRIVQDDSIDAHDPLPKEKDGTKVLKEVFDASADSLFPLQGALGYEIQQTLFVGPNCLIVEGAADLLFLQGVSAVIEREGGEGLSSKWVITPVGGASKVPTYVALLAPQKGINLATLLDTQVSDRQLIEDLYKKKLLEKKRVLTYADFTQTAEADVEDMFDRQFYLDLVNEEYKGALQSPLALGDLNPSVPRVLRAIEDVLAAKPMNNASFGHFRPARYFTENLGKLAGSLDADTKERFSDAFKRINALLS